MRVFYIDSGLEGCYLVRCLLPLMENGWDGDRTSLRESNPLTPTQKAQAANQADVIVFHRPEQKQKLELMKTLKKAGKKVVYDNDDTLKHDGGFMFNELFDQKRIENGMKTLNETNDEALAIADLVTCSTEFLAEEYRKINPNVIVLPNCVDPFLFDEPLKNEGDKVRIGISGSVAITNDVKVLEPIVRHYENDPRVQLVLFALPPDGEDKYIRELYAKEYEFWDSINVERHPFAPVKDYYEALNELRLDMMIIPREDNYFNRCKSNLKFLEASMLEIPVIAQAFSDGLSPYEANLNDTGFMCMATDTQSWIEAIELLINDQEGRRKLGERAKKYVQENYSIEKNAYKWVDAYKTLYE